MKIQSSEKRFPIRDRLTRRRFQFALSAAPLLASSPATLRAASGSGFKLGVASYSLRRFSRTEAIAMIKQLNTPYVNIKEFHLPIKSTPEEVKAGVREFHDAGLQILGGGNISFAKNDDADIRHKFEYAALAGMPLIVCAPSHETLPKLEKYVQEFNIKIAIHNHGPKDSFPAPQDVLKHISGMDRRCGLCVDVGHTAEAGANIVDGILAGADRVFDVHIKDVRDTHNMDSQVPVGDGVLPIPEIFRALQKIGYTGGVMLEYEAEETNPLPGMIKSFAYMRGLLAGIAVSHER